MKICPTCDTTYEDNASFCSVDGKELVNTDQADPSYPLGTVLDDRYRLVQFIGAGGMGEVYRAEHIYIQKTVALKLLRPEITGSAEAVQRFYQEARASSSIGHRNIVTIEDFGKLDDGSIYLAMEYLSGSTLAGLIRKETLPLPRALKIVLQIAHGLSAAHARGIIHRDMKPENVFVIQDEAGGDMVKILDFGIAKINQTDSGGQNLTKTGTIFGTPHYMSPEQALGERLDPRTDLYSLGIVLFELVTGRVPFKAESFLGILTQHVTAEVPHPTRLNPDIPMAMERIILKALSKDREQRQRDMEELIDELQAFLKDFEAPAVAAVLPARPSRSEKRNTAEEPVLLLTHPKPKAARKGSRTRQIVLGGLLLACLTGIVAGLLYFKPWQATPEDPFDDASSTEAAQDRPPAQEARKTQEPPKRAQVVLSREITVSASGYLRASGDLTFFPENVTDGDPSTWWTPYPQRNGRDSWIRLEFPTEKWISAIDLVPGSHHLRYKNIGNLWRTNNRMTRGELAFSDGTRVRIDAVDEDRVQRIEFTPVKSKFVTLFPLEWKPGSRWNDLCISQFLPVELVQDLSAGAGK